MQFKVKKDYLEIVETENTYAKAIDLYNIDINFSEEWDNLAKKMLFINSSDVYEQQIVDNKTVLPNLPNGRYHIGVVGFLVQENKIVKRIPTNLVTKTIITSSAEYKSDKEYTDEDANIYEKYLQAITNISIDINNDIEKIKALEDNILDQYNKNVELADKMEKETEKFAKKADTAIEDYNSNAKTQTDNFNTNAKKKADDFDNNATEKKSEITDIAEGVKNMATAIQLPQFYVDDEMDIHGVTATNLSNIALYYDEKTGDFKEGVTEIGK